LIGSVERRLEQSLEINSKEIADEDWNSITDIILQTIKDLFDNRRDRLLGNGNPGQIQKDLESTLSRVNGPITQDVLIKLLMLMPQGARAAFDKKTHRRVFLRTTRLTYVFYAAQLLEGHETEELTQNVYEHLEKAQSFIQRAWGLTEWSRLADSSPKDLDENAQNGLRRVLGEDTYSDIVNQPFNKITDSNQEKIILELGRQALTELYRQLLLQIITELWVDYLTQMEALRVSIGLEAYAQRDPLVQYKNQAYGLFQELLNNMRRSVVNRMFIYRPRDPSSVQTTVSQAELPKAAPEASGDGDGAKPQTKKPKKSKSKRRRRRRR
jgi:preprotein translocase subunit SecA